MRLIRSFGIVCCLLCSGFGTDLSKGQLVVVKLPDTYWHREGSSRWSGTIIYSADVNRQLLADNRWREEFPKMLAFRLEKTSVKNGATEIEVRSGDDLYLKIRFSSDLPNLEAAKQAIIFKGDLTEFKASSDFRDLFAAQAPNMFKGPAADLSSSAKLKIFEASHFRPVGVNTLEYKGKTYLSIDVGEDELVYNTIQLSQSARVARVMNDRLLKVLGELGPLIYGNIGIYGLQLKFKIPNKDFVHDIVTKRDELELYVPIDVLQKFTNADITSQQLMDDSVVILNGSRVQVPLAQPKA